jgi:2-keto-4-pentenoate hydratase/2-oxohepta-3-ene-1,7-dioic acid hydratase in catechol pathway
LQDIENTTRLNAFLGKEHIMTTQLKNFALGTFSHSGAPEFPGLVIGEKVIPLNVLQPLLEKNDIKLVGVTSILSLLDQWDLNFSVLKKAVKLLADNSPESVALQAQMISVTTLDVLPPINLPRQIFCSGANYFKHVVDLIVDLGPGKTPGTDGMDPKTLRSFAEELMLERQKHGDPYIFSKPVSTICGAYDPIRISPNAIKPDWELELTVVIGKPAYEVKLEDAMNYVAGYTIANDISNRGQIFRRDGMKALGTDWVSGKCSPGYLPLGPYFVPSEFVENPEDIQLKLFLNGEIKQNESTSDMIFGVARLIEYLTQRVKLFPGDIICTGSPAGNGTHYGRFLQAGDVMEASISGLGKQRNTIV